ncbi:MAG TPA: BTAD domain-containing putative transcriptional regulator [Aquihabitans sp.]|nr:BTAD domain-containing putative transcriptional regulator [Aquihabitans sp.]
MERDAGPPDDRSPTAPARRTAALIEAGERAVATDDAGALRLAVRTALAVQPPLVPVPVLRTWRDAEVLDATDPHATWLDAACQTSLGQPLPAALDRFREAMAGFAKLGDVEAELRVGMGAAQVARRLDDLDTLGHFIVRAGELAAHGHPEAAAPARLGEAILSQMLGDPAAALDALDRIDPNALLGEWAAQLSMVRGTNLLLLDRPDEALAHLELAVGQAGSWSQSVALLLLSSARWRTGDRVGALHELEAAEVAAREVGARSNLALVRAQRAAMLAIEGDPGADALAADLQRRPVGDPEAARLLQVARAVAAVVAGDPDEGRRRILACEVPERASPSSMLAIALATALDPSARDRWTAVVERRPALRPALEAGLAGAEHLAGGPLAAAGHRPFLPGAWCEPTPPVVELRLLGRASVTIDRRRVLASPWERGRVRELTLHLVLAPSSARDLVADRLWPDLTSEAAARNLRVTLSYLRTALDPHRAAPDDPLVGEDEGALRLVESPRLRIDLREEAGVLDALAEAAAIDDTAGLLAAARRLRRLPSGPPLGGATVGTWAEPLLRRRRDGLLAAIARAAPAALDAGDGELAEALVQRGLALDPWSERLHQLLVRSRAERDDLDGARRALRDALGQLGELGVAPERATVTLARSIGIELT